VIEDILREIKKEIEDTQASMRKDLAKVRTGRAQAGLLDGITVEYYGAKTHLNQLATINAPEPRLIVVTPFDKGTMGGIEKAIKASDLGLNPMNDGKIIRIPIPELTQERRRDLVKHVKKIAEEFRVSMRNHRRDANDMLKELLKEKQISEDDYRHAHDKVQALTDAGVVQVDQILKAKEEEIMAV
jgi:ribosome recycling factor